MSALMQFHFDSTDIRVMDRNGEPWWIARDVCDPLGLDNVSQAVGKLDPDERGIISSDTPSGPQDMLVINESGLYSLILRSRKPEAKRFKRWITHEVLPSIRRTGAYIQQVQLSPAAPPVLTIEQVREVIRAELAQHSPGTPVGTHRVYLTDYLARCKPKADPETKRRYRQMVKLIADANEIALYRQDATRDGRLYVEACDAWVLQKAWDALSDFKGGRPLPGM